SRPVVCTASRGTRARPARRASSPWCCTPQTWRTSSFLRRIKNSVAGSRPGRVVLEAGAPHSAGQANSSAISTSKRRRAQPSARPETIMPSPNLPLRYDAAPEQITADEDKDITKIIKAMSFSLQKRDDGRLHDSDVHVKTHGFALARF